MPERVNKVESGYIIGKNGKKFLCSLVHVAEKEIHTCERTWFTESDRDGLLSKSLDKLKRDNVVPDFYFERWPQDSARDYTIFFVKPPIVYLKIEFYRILKEL